MDRLKEALKQQEFRDLLVDYANEISDPDYKKVFFHGNYNLFTESYSRQRSKIKIFLRK